MGSSTSAGVTSLSALLLHSCMRCLQHTTRPLYIALFGQEAALLNGPIVVHGDEDGSVRYMPLAISTPSMSRPQLLFDLKASTCFPSLFFELLGHSHSPPSSGTDRKHKCVTLRYAFSQRARQLACRELIGSDGSHSDIDSLSHPFALALSVVEVDA